MSYRYTRAPRTAPPASRSVLRQIRFATSAPDVQPRALFIDLQGPTRERGGNLETVRLLAHVARAQGAWLRTAREQGSTLAVLCLPDAIELYSTTGDARAAFRPVLREVSELVRERPELGATRVVELDGDDASEHLLLRASGVRARPFGDPSAAAAIFAGAALAGSYNVLGPVLASVFWAAACAARRVAHEVTCAQGQPELRLEDRAAAERIVAEELIALRLRHSEAHAFASEVARSLAPISAAEREPQTTSGFPDEEHDSLIRIKIPGHHAFDQRVASGRRA